MVRSMLADEGWMVTHAGSACRLDYCPPDVVECGLCPIRRLCRASDEVAWLRARVAELEDLNARLREAAAARDEVAAAQLAARDAQLAALAARVEELGRRLDKDSSTSSRPPSSDSPYKKKPGTGRCGAGPGASPASSPARSRRR